MPKNSYFWGPLGRKCRTNLKKFRWELKEFRVIGHFETSAINDPQMTLNIKMSKLPRIHVTVTPKSQNFNRFRSAWDKCTEWPKMTLTTKGQSYPYIPHITTQDFRISLCFTLRQAVIGLQAILRQVQRMTPKTTLSTKSKRYPIHISQLHVATAPKSQWPWLWPYKVTQVEMWWYCWTLHMWLPIGV